MTAFCSKPMFLSDLRETLMSALGQKLTDASQELLPEKNADFKDRHILLVEDNELNREIAQEILREYGFRVDTAENGEVAVEKVSTAAPGSYDLVLMDVQMPVMDGYTATRKIRDVYKRQIITCCRFSLHDAAPLKDSLMNLATTNEAGAVYNTCLLYTSLINKPV